MGFFASESGCHCSTRQHSQAPDLSESLVLHICSLGFIHTQGRAPETDIIIRSRRIDTARSWECRGFRGPWRREKVIGLREEIWEPRWRAADESTKAKVGKSTLMETAGHHWLLPIATSQGTMEQRLLGVMMWWQRRRLEEWMEGEGGKDPVFVSYKQGSYMFYSMRHSELLWQLESE